MVLSPEEQALAQNLAQSLFDAIDTRFMEIAAILPALVRQEVINMLELEIVAKSAHRLD